MEIINVRMKAGRLIFKARHRSLFFVGAAHIHTDTDTDTDTDTHTHTQTHTLSRITADPPAPVV